MGGGLFGGGYDAPEVQPVPEKEPTKSVSAGASAAAESQRQKARRNRGVAASIMTQRGNGGGLSTTDQTGKTTLG